MFPRLDLSALETLIMLERAHRLLAVDRQVLWSRYGLTGSRFILLRLLYSVPGRRLNMSEIGANMNLGANGVTQLVDAMSRAGFVERQTGEDDKRVIYAALTKKGEHLFSTVLPKTVERLHGALALLDDEEREILRHLLTKMRMHMLSNKELVLGDHPSDGAG
jgi:MarR family 2-MHQ and catechol resistance regulon transcriptional repressor